MAEPGDDANKDIADLIPGAKLVDYEGGGGSDSEADAAAREGDAHAAEIMQSLRGACAGGGIAGARAWGGSPRGWVWGCLGRCGGRGGGAGGTGAVI